MWIKIYVGSLLSVIFLALCFSPFFVGEMKDYNPSDKKKKEKK